MGEFKLGSDDLKAGTFPAACILSAAYGFGCSGGNQSPQLAWQDPPDGTKSFVVTLYDPDAPTGSGFWHWVLFDIPAGVTELARGAGSGDQAGRPAGTKQGRNDVGGLGFVGAFPPPGHGPHRYVTAVHALDTDQLGPPDGATPAFVGFTLGGHTLARAVIVPTYEVPG